MTKKENRKRPKTTLWYAGLGFFIVITVLGILYYYELESDPVIVEILVNDSEKGTMAKITHLKDGRIDYVFNYSEGLGTEDFLP